MFLSDYKRYPTIISFQKNWIFLSLYTGALFFSKLSTKRRNRACKTKNVFCKNKTILSKFLKFFLTLFQGNEKETNSWKNLQEALNIKKLTFCSNLSWF